MVDDLSKPQKDIMRTMVETELEAEVRRGTEKLNAINRAEEVIFSALSDWTGCECGPGKAIPIIREGERVGQIHPSGIRDNSARKVASASLTKHASELEGKISRLRSITETSAALTEAVNELSYGERARLTAASSVSLDKLRNWHSLPLEERIFREIGSVKTLYGAIGLIVEACEQEVKTLGEELSKREKRRGRPKNEAAYAVAHELARLYAKVTGKRPTYSAGKDGLSGQFTPVLKDVFDALGWEGVDLRGPTESARDGISDDDLIHEENHLGLQFFPLPESWNG